MISRLYTRVRGGGRERERENLFCHVMELVLLTTGTTTTIIIRHNFLSLWTMKRMSFPFSHNRRRIHFDKHSTSGLMSMFGLLFLLLLFFLSFHSSIGYIDREEKNKDQTKTIILIIMLIPSINISHFDIKQIKSS